MTTKPSAMPPTNHSSKMSAIRFGRAVDHPMAARGRGDVVEIAQRHLLAPRHLEQRLGKRLAAIGRLRKVRDRAVERIAGDVVAQPLRHQRERVGRR